MGQGTYENTDGGADDNECPSGSGCGADAFTTPGGITSPTNNPAPTIQADYSYACDEDDTKNEGDSGFNEGNLRSARHEPRRALGMPMAPSAHRPASRCTPSTHTYPHIARILRDRNWGGGGRGRRPPLARGAQGGLNAPRGGCGCTGMWPGACPWPSPKRPVTG